MNRKKDLLLNNTPWKKISGFPYPEKFCIYCEERMLVWKALHNQDEPQHFKAVYVCTNPNCQAYDEDAKEAYVKVYYSSEFAHDTLETQITIDPRKIDERLRRN